MRTFIEAALVCALCQGGGGDGSERDDDPRPFTSVFGERDEDLASTGTNPYFVLEPGYTLVLEGEEDGEALQLRIRVLEQTKLIAGIETRAVEETETVDGEIEEVTRDYFAISKRTNNVYYFGEEVDVYEDGELAGHEGSWLAGEEGASYGLLMPAVPLLGARYQQEIAPGEAMDRGEIAGLSERFECPAGTFEGVLRVLETNAMKPRERELKLYAPGVGLLQDGSAVLIRSGVGIE